MGYSLKITRSLKFLDNEKYRKGQNLAQNARIPATSNQSHLSQVYILTFWQSIASKLLIKNGIHMSLIHNNLEKLLNLKNNIFDLL